jgi:hypothetical protein
LKQQMKNRVDEKWIEGDTMKKINASVFILSLAGSLHAGLYDRDAQGWTVITPSPDSRVIYVSSSEGNDANNGLSPSTPKRTISAGAALLRSDAPGSGGVTGYPDHLLLKRGDTWDATLGGWWKCGRSPAEPMVVGTYGTGPRPILRSASSNFLSRTDAPNDWKTMSNVAFIGLHFQGTAPGGTQSTFFIQSANDILFEDMEYERVSMAFQEWPEGEAEMLRIQIRRNVIRDTFSTVAHQQCIYIDGLGETVVEENVLDRCGWNPNVAEAEPTIFNHCVYWQSYGPADGIVRDNIVSRCSSHGLQMRSSGNVLGNLIVRAAIAGFTHGDYEPIPDGVKGTVIGNVILESEDIMPREGHTTGNLPRGWGWELKDALGDLKQVIMRDNITAHCLGHGCKTGEATFEESEIVDNIVWDWPQGGGNMMPPTPGPFVDPDRNLATYHGTLGRTESFESFMEEARKQSKDNWRTEYTAAPVIAYIRAGFARPGGDGMPPARPRGLRVR